MSPLYQRVLQDLTDKIASGALAPGAMLPSEADLGAAYGVSQGTARKALNLLESRGIVERTQGRGTFVAVSTDERALFHFFRLRDVQGRRVVPELVRQGVARRPATPGEAEVLGASEVFEIDRLRRVQGRVALRERVVLDAARFPGLGERQTPANALYPFYQRAYGVTVLTASEQIAPRCAHTGGEQGLDIAAGDPLLEVWRRAADVTGTVAEMRHSVHAMQGLRYAVELK